MSLENAVGEMMADLISEDGAEFTYHRGTAVTTPVTMVMSKMPTVQVENESGGIVYITPVNFKLLTANLPYATPLQGDTITGGGERFELSPGMNEKVFRKLSPQMTRLHAKQIG